MKTHIKVQLNLKGKLLEDKTPKEDEELAREKASHMAEGGLQVVMRKVAVLELPDQQKKVIMREAVGHTSEAGEMAVVEGLVINVIGVINGDTDHLNV